MGSFFKRKKDEKTLRRERFEREALVHLDALYGLALRLTRSESDADDLVQDALLRAYRFFDSYQPGSNIRAWLFKIVTNTFYNSIRKSGNIRRLETEAETGWHYERFISSASASGQSAEDALLDSMSAERLRAAIEELAEDFRVVVVLCDVHGFSYKEIAEIVDCPVGTVMSRLHRGRRQLQKKLYECAREHGLLAMTEADSTAERSHAVSSATPSSEGGAVDLAVFRERAAGRVRKAGS